jgi:hypothetical protein
MGTEQLLLKKEQNLDNYRYGWVSVFKSFGDAPDGFSEEVKEVTYAVGIFIPRLFSMRVGYFHESP